MAKAKKQKQEKIGRPKEGLDTLPKGWTEEILNLYREGASDVEVRAWIWEQRGSFSDDLWERWIEEEPAFSRTVKLGRSLSQAWWEKQGRTQLVSKYQGDSFSYTGWYMNMKNRFKWKDRHDHTSGDEKMEGLVVYTPEEEKDE